jgi:excisionase family DNA binding protein
MSISTAVTAVVAALLTEQIAAELLHLKKQTLRAWRVRRKGPPFYKLNGRILYKREDLEAWIEQCRIVPGERRSRGRGRTAIGRRRGSR